MSVHARHPESPGLNARFAYGAVQVGVTWLLALGPILLLITIILPLCHQINKGINNIINIINLEYFGYIIGSKLTIIILSIYFLMNGNIFNYSLASEQYKWNCGWFGCDSASAIPPNPPANTINGEPIFVQSYINAYNTAFNQETSGYNLNYQKALNEYQDFNPGDINSNFVSGTFGSREQYNSLSQSQSITIYHLQDIASVYSESPYLFISTGSGGGSGFMYLNWIIVTYGVPYVISIS